MLRGDRCSIWTRFLHSMKSKILSFTQRHRVNLNRYLLIAYDSAINVYATSTSLLVRRLRMSKADRVTAFALSPSKMNHIFVSTNTGSIEKWDWVEGCRLEYWHISTPIYHLATSSSRPKETPNDLVYTVDRKGESQWLLTVHRLLGGDEASKTDLGTLIKYAEPLTSVKVLDNGRIIVLTSGSRLVVGTSDKPNLGSLKNITYVWRDVKCPEWITTMDVQIRPHERAGKKAEGPNLGCYGALDVAIGTLRGQIIIYDDFLKSLISKESNTKTETRRAISSQRIHWHRNAVLALKWSKDGRINITWHLQMTDSGAGNYIISGGLESVLVLWQLETGKKQVLPHLSTSIESIVVSPSGSSYSVRLADNSNMILSTLELKPTFNVAGIQVPALRKSGISLPFIPTVNAPSPEFLPKENLKYPAILNPAISERLLVAVPSSTASRINAGAHAGACYLQSFDLNSGQQTSKQSLTRTKATTLNMGPEANMIEEPNVAHMQISNDGQWLATIDEWMPPRRDISLMAFDSEKELEEQSRRRETYLKFWLWNDVVSTWELVSRIDNPHSSLSNIKYDANMVLDLQSDPAHVGFATIGNDSIVKFWSPSIRRRHGKEVRDKTGRALSNWSYNYTVFLESLLATSASGQHGAKLAYSRDGSVLAAGYSLSMPSMIHLIDSSSGRVRRTLTGLHSGPLLGMGIIDRYLIILSDELRIWDMVTEQHSFGFALPSCGLTIPNLAAGSHLATHFREETFAISIPQIRSKSSPSGKSKSQIFIFNPKSPVPLFSTSTANTITAILPATGRKGYYVLDSAAEIKLLSPALHVPTTLPEDTPLSIFGEPKAPTGLENIYGSGTRAALRESSDEEEGNDEASRTKRLRKGEMIASPGSVPKLEKPDAVVVTQDALTQLFDTSSAFTLPPMMELYEQVARLCVGKK